MHKASSERLTPGTVLAKSIYTEKGEILLARGVALTSRYIQAMIDRGYPSVYVMDGIADDVVPVGLISDQLYARAVATVRSVYLERKLNNLLELSEAILDEVLDEDVLTCLASLKAHDSYPFEHPVEVAVYAAMLGRRMGLARVLLKDVAVGCLLIDVGLQLIDPEILNKPDQLTAAELEQVAQHSVLGYQLVRQMTLPSPRCAAIVLQHHERQDGSGYPNHLFGTNRVSRTEQERFDPRRISLMAEMAAIADVYSALTSDRPHRPALPADTVFAVLDQESGRRLNTDLLRLFVSSVQHFPVGAHVRLSGDNFDQSLGVVVRVTANTPARPVVRLMFDARGQSLGEGQEIDLREQPSTVGLHVLPQSGLPLDAIARKRAAGAA